MLRGRLAWRGLAAACRRPHTSQRASGINNSAFTPTHRCFSIDGQAARTLLTDKGHVGLSADQIRISSPAGAFPPSSPSFPPPLAFVLHADRRPQMLPNGKTHFGPSLLVCRSDALPAVSSDDKKLGHGDLGMLRLQMESPSSVAQVPIFVGQGGGLSEADARAAIAAVDPEGDKSPRGAAAILLSQLWKIFEECEGIWFSGMITGSGKDAPAVVSQPFLSFDPFALHRVQSPTLQHLYSTRERDKVTARAEDGGLFYINLGTQGDIGSFGYGAGNAMGTMDGLSNAGGKPANFLDGGGGANRQNAKLAIETLNSDPNVKTIFVNTFGGITQTDVVADGIIDAVREHDMQQTIVVRVKGTGSDEAKRKLSSSGLANFILIDDFREAASEAVRQSKQQQRQQQ